MDVFVRAGEACAAPRPLQWDTVWTPAGGSGAFAGAGDWALAGPSEPGNAGGLRALAAIETAVVICLFTDRRCPPDHPLAKWAADGANGADLRGWWGDGIDVRDDLGETAMGSLLWLLERSTATPDTARWAKSFAIEALAPLIGQGGVVRVDAQSEVLALPEQGIALAVQLYGRDGLKIYDRRFDALWAQLAAAPPLPPAPCGPVADTLRRPGATIDFGLASAPAGLGEDFGDAAAPAGCIVDLGRASS